jgi:hypothetical protein
LPGCGLGVIVPTSIKPNPNAPNESIKSPFLSSPAAIPSLFLKVRPLNLNASEEFLYGKRMLRRLAFI